MGMGQWPVRYSHHENYHQLIGIAGRRRMRAVQHQRQAIEETYVKRNDILIISNARVHKLVQGLLGPCDCVEGQTDVEDNLVKLFQSCALLEVQALGP
jgi:hypothetical protein